MASATNDVSTSPPAPAATSLFAIFMVGVVGLFLELLLIRWISTEVRIFAYLQNTVLVVCFLGLGMGCFTSTKPANWRDVSLPLFFLALLLAVPATRMALHRLSQLLSTFSDMLTWAPRDAQSPWYELLVSIVLGLSLTFLLMLLLWQIFVPFGRLMGRLLNHHPRPVWAYSWNVAGSLLGTWLFVILCAWQLPPLAWFLVLIPLMLILLWCDQQLTVAHTGLLALFLGAAWCAQWEPDAREVLWSPYQKLVLESENSKEPGVQRILVNNFGYQVMQNLSSEFINANPNYFGSAPRQDATDLKTDSWQHEEMIGYGQYDIPHLLHQAPKKVLIVGAGSGNDVAGALRHGAEQIVAVEIDPVIIRMGKENHPEKPYQSSKVRVVVDDARSYFAKSNEQFDVIIFGLLDSHTTTAMTNARLDHYVYTRESLAQAKKLLQPGGILVLSFQPEAVFVADRMASVIRAIFGEEPFTFLVPASKVGWGGIFFVAGNESMVQAQLVKYPLLRRLIQLWRAQLTPKLTYTTAIATDDWPYIYLDKPRIPNLYFVLAGLLAALYIVGARFMGEVHLLPRLGREQWHFAFLGAAFLLLEVQNISKAAVALGNTWDVNAVIISAVLMMVLLANAMSARWPTLPLFPVYGLLLGSCLGLYFVDLARFASLPYAVKAVVVGGLATIPMLFSGIVFVRSFTATSAKDEALGANLFGSLVGGVLQSVTFLTGIKALLLLVAALYLGAILTRPKSWT